VLNSQGVEVRKLDAQRTPEQAAAEARTQQNVFRQKQHDTFLITNYASVKDIEALREVRLDQLRGQKSAATQYGRKPAFPTQHPAGTRQGVPTLQREPAGPSHAGLPGGRSGSYAQRVAYAEQRGGRQE